MKTKRYIAYFLFFISMIMLTVPVIPHHHHEDGMICMKNDLHYSVLRDFIFTHPSMSEGLNDLFKAF